MQLKVPQHLEKADVERLPCGVDYRGPVPQASAFLPQPSSSDNGEPPKSQESKIGDFSDQEAPGTASFRGRLLRHADVALPDDTKGFIVRNDDDAPGKPRVVSHQIARLSYYTHESVPDLHDSLPKSMQFLSVSKALHGAVDVKDPAK